MTGIKLTMIGYAHHHKTILQDVSMDITPNHIVCLTGPNGSGKSTLLQIIAGIIKPTQGEVILDQTNIHQIAKKSLAKNIAFLPQQSRIPKTLTVREYVALGRYCYQSWLSDLSEQDHAAIDHAIALTDLTAMANNEAASLSLGQQQRARIALTLAQSSQYILLDEPMTGLDLKQQFNMLNLLQRLRSLGKTIIVILHDLHQVKEVADQVIMLKDGQLIASGKPTEVLNPKLICEVFECHCNMLMPKDGLFKDSLFSEEMSVAAS